MFPASTKGGGTCFAMPDVCKVPAPPAPPIPTPFPNTGQVMQANPGTCAKKVKIVNNPVVHKTTQIPMSQGDEAGVAGGLVSGMNMGPIAYKAGVPKVKVEGNDIVNQLKMTGHNGTNANMPAGNQVAPSQTKVIVNG